ncbi:acetyltransferase [Clostridium sp. AUH-JLR23]|uniref:acetyltransferase n=1 Tax=Clostridium sp. AUH-JLR23 TaxID=1505062 RepID=UPI00356A2117
MKKIIIFGLTDFEKRLKYYIEKYTNDQVVAFTVNKQFIKLKTFEGKPVIDFESIESYYNIEEYEILIGIGYKDMNSLRKRIVLEAIDKGYKLYTFIHPNSLIDDSVCIDEGNIIMSGVIIDYNVKIGKSNIIEIGCNIAHETLINDYNYFAPSVSIGGKVKIKNNSFFGLNATIRSAITVNNYSLIGAGCYLNKSTKEYGVYVPAKSTLLKKNSTEINILYEERIYK